jgi:starch-binding outer membrane protein, SusD/RagB family
MNKRGNIKLCIMKKWLFFLTLIVIITSCDKVFKEDEINKLTIETPGDLEYAISGMYYRFASIAQNGSAFTDMFANADDISYWSGFVYSSDKNCRQNFSGYNLSDDELVLIYKPLYQTIASANDILSKSGKMSKNDPVIQNLLGEVYFIRAYAYFWLVRIFGQVPIVDNTDVNYLLKKSSFEEIYSFIEKDLQRALSLLPGSATEARIKYITPHRGSAKALLAEVYLTWAGYPVKDVNKYADAARLSGEVIDSANYFGYGLMPDLADLWNGKHDVNQESVFSLYFSGTLVPLYNQNYKSTDYLPTDLYLSTPHLGRGHNPIAAIQFFNFFPNNYRKEITYLCHLYYVYTPRCITSPTNPSRTFCPPPETIAYHYDTIDLCTQMLFRKYYTRFNLSDSDLTRKLNDFPNYNSNFYDVEGNVIYLYRYAHTLLTYAEARARSGNLDASAYEAVNQVRRRASKTEVFSPSIVDLKPGLTVEQFIDSVVWERAWEFCAEPEGRYFDLLRLEMLSKLKLLKDPQQGVIYPITNNLQTYFLPIPKSELMLNPNLK